MDEAQEGGLPVALLADERGALARAELERKVREYAAQVAAAGDAEFVYRKHKKARSFACIAPACRCADAQKAGLPHKKGG